MTKKVPVLSVAEVKTASLAGLPLEASVALADVAGAVKEGLVGFCADVGLMVMAQTLDAEMTARVGPKHAKIPDRQANWHGTTTGPVVLGGRQVTVTRPSGSRRRGGGDRAGILAGVLVEGSVRPVDGGADVGRGRHPPAR